MSKRLNVIKMTSISLLVLLLGACASAPMTVSSQAKPGFSNITDVPIPQTAEMVLSKSMIMGGGDTWTGHLVYTTNKPPKQVIDFTSEQMQMRGWTKASEQRGIESLITFIKQKRVATIRIAEQSNYFTNDTYVTIDMANSNIKNIMADQVESEADEG